MIYLDHNATTPPAPEVVEAMTASLTQEWGNPSSMHACGQQARAACESARRSLAWLIHAQPSNILFTSGATEAVTQLLLGPLLMPGAQPRHLIISAIEHPCVLEPAHVLETLGWRVTRVGVDAAGRVNPQAVAAAIRPDTALISIMLANNDTGVIQPVQEIAALARRHHLLMHTDAVQAVGRIPVDFEAFRIDFLTLSAHKFYGPKGVGALVVRDVTTLAPLLFGGSQERSLRAGTENLPGICGLGAAARLAARKMDADAVRLAALRDRLQAGLLTVFPDACVNGGHALRLPNTLNITFPGIDAVTAVMNLDIADIAVATTSACSTAARQPPYVLTAMGLPPEAALASLRFSLGRANTEAEIDRVIATLTHLIPQLRS
ncbi:MAG: cysteine desulfurase family protein [bacterium]